MWNWITRSTQNNKKYAWLSCVAFFLLTDLPLFHLHFFRAGKNSQYSLAGKSARIVTVLDIWMFLFSCFLPDCCSKVYTCVGLNFGYGKKVTKRAVLKNTNKSRNNCPHIVNSSSPNDSESIKVTPQSHQVQKLLMFFSCCISPSTQKPVWRLSIQAEKVNAGSLSFFLCS